MILPDRWPIMNLLASWANSKAAVRLTDTMGSHCSRPNFPTSDSRLMPAELTRISTEPSVSTQRCTMAAGTPACVMSATANSIRRPARSISRRVVPSSSARPTAKTSAPAVARAAEKARPRPVLPPVTRALRPARENRSRLKSEMSMGQLPSEVRGGWVAVASSQQVAFGLRAVCEAGSHPGRSVLIGASQPLAILDRHPPAPCLLAEYLVQVSAPHGAGSVRWVGGRDGQHAEAV